MRIMYVFNFLFIDLKNPASMALVMVITVVTGVHNIRMIHLRYNSLMMILVIVNMYIVY